MIVLPALPILIVDDSALARQMLKAIIEADPGFRAIVAVDPYDAVDVMKRTLPSAMLLDINMPRMDGLTFLRKLRRQHPLPVLLCTDDPAKGLAGLEMGALEVIPKPQWENPTELARWGERLRESLRLAVASANTTGPPALTPLSEAIKTQADPRYSADAILPAKGIKARLLPPDREWIIAIGASTGGVQAIAKLLADFPAESPGIVIVQHMRDGGFTEAFADRLDRDTKIPLEVLVARHGEPILPGRVLIAPDGFHGVVRRIGHGYRLEMVEGPLVNRFRPSVDVLYRSVAQAAGDRSVGIILTGMLDDGVQGLMEMRQAGAWTIAQDKATSTVFGMNGEAIRRGAVCQVLPLDKIAAATVDVAR